MKQKLLESKYRDDLVTLSILILIGCTSRMHSVLPFVLGALFSLIPRVVSVYHSEDGRSKSERARTVVLFCLYFFLGLWSLDWADSAMQPLVAVFLFGAAIYQMVVWLAISSADRKDREPNSTGLGLTRLFSIAMVYCTAMFAIRFFQGVKPSEALGSYSLIVVLIVLTMLRTDYRRKVQ